MTHLLAAALPLTAFFVANISVAQTTAVMSVDSFGNQSQGSSGGFGGTAISADGRRVVFDTYAWLVPGSSPALVDHDRLTGETVRIAPWISHSPSISADGRFVAFETRAILTPGDSSDRMDVYLWDRTTGQYEAISVDPFGAFPPSPYESGATRISADGRFVMFFSNAGVLDPADSFAGWDAFLRDRQAGTTTVLSTGATAGALSDDGNWAVFSSLSFPLSLQVWSRASGLVTGFSAGSTIQSTVAPTSISRDGNLIIFQSPSDVYILDLALDLTERISTPAHGPPFGGGHDGRITPDGRFVTFTGSDSQAYLVDRVLGTSECVSRSWNGTQVNGGRHAMTPDGRFVAFGSLGTNVVPNQTNPEPGIYLRDRQAVPEVVSFCHGDGSGGACPCANFVAAGTPSGCMNSTGIGASLTASGGASVAADTVLLTTTGMPSSVSLYVRGTSRTTGGIGTAFGDGLRCIAGTLTRLGTRPITGGTSTFPQPNVHLSAYGALAGVAQQYQTWYRNPAPAFCSPGTFNLSNGLTILWGP